MEIVFCFSVMAGLDQHKAGHDGFTDIQPGATANAIRADN
jgi:hypothetical protein